jgi:alkanesulfonate monooxygenase SsuD/methylene tetrahydromethanopterin reductase-like flavin-dependent oxidoreductase (luciferase family)
MWNEQNFPLMREFGWVKYVKDDDTEDADVDIEYLIDHLWMVGSPETVTQRLIEQYETLGGFGTVVVNKYDYGDTPDAYRRSLELFAKEVIPAFEKSGVE